MQLSTQLTFPSNPLTLLLLAGTVCVRRSPAWDSYVMISSLVLRTREAALWDDPPVVDTAEGCQGEQRTDRKFHHRAGSPQMGTLALFPFSCELGVDKDSS